MGLLDNIIGGIAGNVQGHGTLLDGVLGMINNPATGGPTGLADTFRSRGLGGVMESWISTGQNLPISAEQIRQVLSSEQIDAIANKLGISHADVSSHLADLLPQVIDKLTPHGQLPAGGALDQALGMLKGKLG